MKQAGRDQQYDQAERRQPEVGQVEHDPANHTPDLTKRLTSARRWGLYPACFCFLKHFFRFALFLIFLQPFFGAGGLTTGA